MSDDRRAVEEVEAAGVNGCNSRFQEVVSCCKLTVRPKVAETSEEDIVRCLQTGRSDGEDILGRKCRDGGN